MVPACIRNSAPVAAASIHSAGVYMACFSVHSGSSPSEPSLAVLESCSPSPSGLSPTSSGRWAISRDTGSRATAQTMTPSTIHARCQSHTPMTRPAISGNTTIPAEWHIVRIPLALPLSLMNQRDTTTDAPICTGLEKITRPVP